MSPAIIDLALRAGTVALLLVLAATLFRDFRNVVAGRLAVAFALGSAAHAVTSGIGATTPGEYRPLADRPSHVPVETT